MALSRTPILIAEFLTSIRRRGLYNWRYGIGICVSGGPDSMALAALFSKVKRSGIDLSASNAVHGPVRAFIVDHQAREGSAEEAKIVARRLQSLGIESEILRLKWPPGIVPAQIPDFETKARTERYRLLARAAIRNNIRDLYVGHHQDDQIETMLMRMSQPRGNSGLPPNNALTGMRRVTSIPCCGDIWGAFDAESRSRHIEDGEVHLAHRGITLVRPFLDYPKARLEATCDTMGVPYFIDKTNLDPTRTARNAVRYLLSHPHLPRALQRIALVNTQKRIGGKVDDFRSSQLIDLWGQVKIRHFDLRSGLLLVQLPDRLNLVCKESFAALAYVLVDLVDAVSPANRGTVSLSAETVDHLFKILNRDPSEAPASTANNAVNVAGLMIEPSMSNLRLYRQPMRRSDHTKLMQFSLDQPQREFVDDWSWTEWMSWDNRYWLRCKVHASGNASDYYVRSYTEADVAPVRSRFRKVSAKSLRDFDELLRNAAPGKIRFTLPVIVKDGHIVAFPTINLLLPSISTCDTWGDPSSRRRPWEVRFKRQSLRILRAWQRGRTDVMPPEIKDQQSEVKDWQKFEFWAAAWGKYEGVKSPNFERSLQEAHARAQKFKRRWLNRLQRDIVLHESKFDQLNH